MRRAEIACSRKGKLQVEHWDVLDQNGIVSRSFRGVGTVVFGVITNDDQVKDNKATDGVGKGTNLI
jgi:hypothetical protein